MQDRLRTVIENDEASFLRLVLDTVSDCLVVVDTEGEIVLINRPYCDLLGGEPEDFIGRHVRDAVSPSSHLAMVAQGALPLQGTPLTVRGREIVTRQVPIWLDGEIIGALGMALFANAKIAESTLRQLTGEALVLPAEQSPWRARYTVDDLVGRGPEMQKLRAQIRQCGRNALPVLIHGETGVGKELVAQATHRLSGRATRPFVWINCATIPPDLVASELFGYEGGSFTGANARGGKGKIELADQGTLFLDEIGDMPLHAQAALLRFLQEGEVTRVGGMRSLKVDARVICASHRDLAALVQAGHFREDLFYRLQVLRIDVPALRERTDLDLLVSHLLARIRIELNLPRLAIGKVPMAQLRRHHWPGNVRELQAALQRAAVSLPEGAFEITDMDAVMPPPMLPQERAGVGGPCAHGPATLAETMAQVERQAVMAALVSCQGNRSKAAKQLGIDRTSLYKRLRAFDLAVGTPGGD